MRAARLGDDIDDFCVKCKRVMNHSVVSILNTAPAKVRCRTCHSDHDFRHEQAPPPKVDSALIRLIPRPQQPDRNQFRAMEKITAAAFGQRRKMLRGALKSLGGEALLRDADINPERRAETLSVQEFVRLTEILLRNEDRG